jgi:hypothetical protein
MVKDDNASCVECSKCCALRHFYEETGIKFVSYKQIELEKNLGIFFVISLETKPSIDIKNPIKTFNKLKSMNSEFNKQALKKILFNLKLAN